MGEPRTPYAQLLPAFSPRFSIDEAAFSSASFSMPRRLGLLSPSPQVRASSGCAAVCSWSMFGRGRQTAFVRAVQSYWMMQMSLNSIIHLSNTTAAPLSAPRRTPCTLRPAQTPEATPQQWAGASHLATPETPWTRGSSRQAANRDADCVQVVIRVRPPSDAEERDGALAVLEGNASASDLHLPNPERANGRSLPQQPDRPTRALFPLDSVAPRLRHGPRRGAGRRHAPGGGRPRVAAARDLQV
jgi:hypothetical protein